MSQPNVGLESLVGLGITLSTPGMYEQFGPVGFVGFLIGGYMITDAALRDLENVSLVHCLRKGLGLFGKKIYHVVGSEHTYKA